MPITSFNSKRCDYEYQTGSVNTLCFDSFNSKRCDYEKDFINRRRSETSFNSKRCDYEQKTK